MSASTATAVPTITVPTAAVAAITDSGAEPHCEFDVRQGVWHLSGGHDSFYSVSLDRALDHARSVYGDLPVAISTTDAEVNRLLDEIDACEPTATAQRAAIRDQLQQYLDSNDIALGRDDLGSLIDTPAHHRRSGSILDGWEPIVIAASGTPSPTDRVVAAVVDRERLVVLLDGERQRNKALLDQGAFFVRRAGNDWKPTGWSVDTINAVSDAERRQIEQATSAPLAVANLEVRAHRNDKPAALVVPVERPADIGATSGLVTYLAERLERPVEYVLVVQPDALFPQDIDDLVAEVAAISDAGPIEASGRLILADSITDAILDVCRDRLTCMKTHATPYESTSFVGSHAAALLEVSSEPVLLIGPNVDATKPPSVDDIAIALGGDIDEVDLFLPARRLADALGVGTRWIHIVTPNDENLIVDEDDNTRFWYPGSARTTLTVNALAGDGKGLGHQLAEATTRSILAMSTHARRGLNRIAEGSITFDAIGATTHPVLAIGPGAQALSEANHIAPTTTVVTSRAAIHALIAARENSHDACDATYRPAHL